MKSTRERLSEPLRRFALPPILGGLVLCLISPAAAQHIAALSGNGTLSWTNGLVNGA